MDENGKRSSQTFPDRINMSSQFPPSHTSTTHQATLDVYLLGVVDYDSAIQLQNYLVYELSGRTDQRGVLLICEHPPIITIGREGSHSHIAVESEELKSRSIPVQWVNRGGGCFIHAPGQIAVYPILPLQRLGLGLDSYRNILEQSVIRTCSKLNIAAELAENSPGTSTRLGQIAHLGIAVKSWISYHGIFLNATISPDWFQLVNSKSTGTPITTMQHNCNRPLSVGTIKEHLVSELTKLLRFQQTNIFTRHPWLQRTTRPLYDS